MADGNRKGAGGQGGRNKSNQNQHRLKTIAAGVSESTKIQIDDIFRRFISDLLMREFTFPDNLSSHERAYVHDQAMSFGLRSQSHGTGEKRRVTLSKLQGIDRKAIRELDLSEGAQRAIFALRQLEEESQRESQRFKEGQRHGRILALEGGDGSESRRTDLALKSGLPNRLSTGPQPNVPGNRKSTRFDVTRQKLPIWEFQEEILDTIKANQVTFIKGDTGCGKTTQVPQFILDDATRRKGNVRILCTVPRRIAAVSISDRVASERGEVVGQTVGYQIRLESRYSPVKTLLTFCTSGILLRSLTAFDYSVLKNTTHIIVDEIHERDRQTDFLLACLRDVCRNGFPTIRLILMGADMDIGLMRSYFEREEISPPIIQVQGRLFPVNVLFLEDILGQLGYRNPKMGSGNRCNNSNPVLHSIVNQFSNFNVNEATGGLTDEPTNVNNDNQSPHQYQHQPDIMEFYGVGASASSNVNCTSNPEADSLIRSVWEAGDGSAIPKFFRLIINQAVSVDYRHQETQATMLMACAIRGWTKDVRNLLALGADSGLQMFIHIQNKFNGFLSAKDWAVNHGHDDVRDLLIEDEYRRLLTPPRHTRELTADAQERLTHYLKSVDDDRVDLNLLLVLIHSIHTTTDLKEAILVFLPGYEEIITMKEMLFSDERIRDNSYNFKVFLLHSNIQTGDQKAVFDRLTGIRKIVLSTNIAETSLTIEDIVHVIDSGRAKEKSFDAFSGVSQLKSNWISKASANQRHGRAGRCQAGTCYRLYSFARYTSFTPFPIPEIVRSSLQELSLYTRSFIRPEVNIQDFFSLLPEPPAPIAVQKSVDMLISMGALDEKEQLTKLGLHLLDLPIEPSLGKALVYAIAMKCLDPVLTMVTIMSYRDPFQLPANATEKKKAHDTKRMFSYSSLSDHLAALRAFQDWENSRLLKNRAQAAWCRNNFVSNSCFEMVYGIRAQILSQLRASGFVQGSNSQGSRNPSDLVDLNMHSNCWPVVKGVLAATIFPNICYIDAPKKLLYNDFEPKVTFHSACTTIMDRKFEDIPSPWVLYDEMCLQGNGKVIRNCTNVGDLAVALFAGSFTLNPEAYMERAIQLTMLDPESQTNGVVAANTHMQKSEKRFDLNNWISFRGSPYLVDTVLLIRKILQNLIFKRLQNPTGSISKQHDDKVVTLIAIAMCEEDKKLGFAEVPGVGQWPKFVAGNMMSVPRTGFERAQAVMADEEDYDTEFPQYSLE